jgi:hypothetical protein
VCVCVRVFVPECVCVCYDFYVNVCLCCGVCMTVGQCVYNVYAYEKIFVVPYFMCLCIVCARACVGVYIRALIFI